MHWIRENVESGDYANIVCWESCLSEIKENRKGRLDFALSHCPVLNLLCYVDFDMPMYST